MSAPHQPDPGSPSEHILLQYGDRAVAALRGQRLLDAILQAGIDHRHICGGHGFCTSCRVEILEGDVSPVSRLERERLGREAGRLRLACQMTVHGDVSIRVPAPLSNRFSPYDE